MTEHASVIESMLFKEIGLGEATEVAHQSTQQVVADATGGINHISESMHNKAVASSGLSVDSLVNNAQMSSSEDEETVLPSNLASMTIKNSFSQWVPSARQYTLTHIPPEQLVIEYQTQQPTQIVEEKEPIKLELR